MRPIFQGDTGDGLLEAVELIVQGGGLSGDPFNQCGILMGPISHADEEILKLADQTGLSPEAKAKINGSIDVEFDPDEWLDRLKTGIPEVELLVRTVNKPVSPVRGALQRGYRHVGKTEVEVAAMSRTLSN